MSKMTDESVAKALGWEIQNVKSRIGSVPSVEHRGWVDHSGLFRGLPWELPKFTTSLDAIVAEVRAHKASVWVQQWLMEESLSCWEPENIAMGLIAYLKEPR